MAVPKQSTVIYFLCHIITIIFGFFICAITETTSIWWAVGGSLVAAGFGGCVIFIHTRFSESTRHRLDVLSDLGLQNAFEARSLLIKDEYHDRIVGAKRQIDVLGFGLRALREDFGKEMDKWKRNVKVRILLIDPRFPSEVQSYANQRDKEEGKEIGEIGKDVKQFIKELGPLASLQGQLQIRLYNCLPTINIFRVDNVLFWGPYLIEQQSRNCPTFLINSYGTLFERFTKHFDTIWENYSVEIPKDWFDKK